MVYELLSQWAWSEVGNVSPLPQFWCLRPAMAANTREGHDWLVWSLEARWKVPLHAEGFKFQKRRTIGKCVESCRWLQVEILRRKTREN